MAGEVFEFAHGLFDQPFWLDAVAPGEWEAVEVCQGRLVHARLPYVLQRASGHTQLRMPPLTQWLGPWIGSEGNVDRLAREKDLMAQLLSRLPAFDYYQQCWHWSMTNWLPFYWAGFSQTTRYTYLLPDLRDIGALHHAMREGTRRKIRNAARQLEVRICDDVDRLLHVVSLTFKRQGIPFPLEAALVRRIEDACAKRDCGRAFMAWDTQGRPHAAVYLVWDANCAHYLFGGADPALRRSNGQTLLLWHAIKHAAQVSKAFNFEGSMIEPVERHFRSFGSQQTPYFSVTKSRSSG